VWSKTIINIYYLRIIFDNTSDKLHYPTGNSVRLQQISIASKKSVMNKFFKKTITKKLNANVNPTDERPENTIPSSSDGATIPAVNKRHSSAGKAPDPTPLYEQHRRGNRLRSLST